MNGLADVDGFKICDQACVLLGFPPLVYVEVSIVHGKSQLNTSIMKIMVHVKV